MSNNKLTDRKIAEILARAEICDDSVLTDYTDIAAAMRELQERRRLDGIQHAVCEVCGVPCNNPNHPQMAVAHEYSAQPVPVVPDDGRAEFEAWMLKKWGASGKNMISQWVSFFMAKTTLTATRGICGRHGQKAASPCFRVNIATCHNQ